jgi:pimeloyl-ACP methyl ester carboxylesterase
VALEEWAGECRDAVRRPGRPPAVLLHGTNDTSATLRPLVDALRRDGRDATTLDYGWHRHGLRGRFGQGGLAPLAESTREVVAAAAAILARPHTPYVDLVGHSQGGLHALACAAALPDRVAHVVLLGSPLWGVTPLGRSSRVAHSAGLRHALDWALGPSARGMVAGSGRLPDLTALPSGPRYLLVASRDDRLVRPAYLAGDIDPPAAGRVGPGPGARAEGEPHDAGVRPRRDRPRARGTRHLAVGLGQVRPTASAMRSSCSGVRSAIPSTAAQAGTISPP